MKEIDGNKWLLPKWLLKRYYANSYYQFELWAVLIFSSGKLKTPLQPPSCAYRYIYNGIRILLWCSMVGGTWPSRNFSAVDLRVERRSVRGINIEMFIFLNNDWLRNPWTFSHMLPVESLADITDIVRNKIVYCWFMSRIMMLINSISKYK